MSRVDADRIETSGVDVVTQTVPGAPSRDRAAGLLERIAPVTLATDKVLPVLPVLEPLLPWGGVARGLTVAATGPGASTMAMALVAAPSSAGSWAAVVGLPMFGWAAAADLGVALDRVGVVAAPSPEQWSDVVGALIGAVDLIVVRPTHTIPDAHARRLAARARERGSVLIHVHTGRSPAWPVVPDVTFTLRDPHWDGVGNGHGHLRGRRIRVDVTGRRRAARPRTTHLWLPGADGGIHAADVPVGVPAGAPVGVPVRDPVGVVTGDTSPTGDAGHEPGRTPAVVGAHGERSRHGRSVAVG